MRALALAALAALAFPAAAVDDHLDEVQVKLARQRQALAALADVMEELRRISDQGPAALNLLPVEADGAVGELRDALAAMQAGAPRELAAGLGSPAAPPAVEVPSAEPEPAAERPRTREAWRVARSVAYAQRGVGETPGRVLVRSAGGGLVAIEEGSAATVDGRRVALKSVERWLEDPARLFVTLAVDGTANAVIYPGE